MMAKGAKHKNPVQAAAWGGWLTLPALLLIAVQSGYLLIQGESFCPTSGCTIVEERSPLSPLLLNGAGFAFFALLCVLFVGVRRYGGGLFAGLLGPLLLAGMAVEGVLFTFQYQTGAFCLYCCTLLAAVVLLNTSLGWRQGLRALFVFAAVVATAVLFLVPKGQGLAQYSIEAGTLALKKGEGREERYFFFAEECSHCKTALAALAEDRAATLHLNPLAPLRQLALPSGMERRDDFTPEANRAFLAQLGITTVPVLLMRQEGGGMRILQGEREIMAHIRGTGASRPEAELRQGQSSASPMDFLIPGSDGCSTDTGCSQ